MLLQYLYFLSEPTSLWIALYQRRSVFRNFLSGADRDTVVKRLHETDMERNRIEELSSEWVVEAVSAYFTLQLFRSSII